jgi:putative cardiolipin synthase
MFTDPNPSAQLPGLRRAIAWLALAGGGLATLGMAWRTVLLTVAVALGGCAALPRGVERPASYAQADVSDTALAKIAAASTPAGEVGASGFRLLADGADAFAARIALMRRAEATLDVQYYLIADDASGREFLQELSAAAARGVRVRILVDDLYATGHDAQLANLAARDRIQVRLFNPLPARSGGFVQRIVFSMHEFSRINRRMHNKLFIADGSFAVTGGRNIADAYFDRSGDDSFIDMDVLSSGPVVARLAEVFDRYWNSEAAYPIGSLSSESPAGSADTSGRPAGALLEAASGAAQSSASLPAAGSVVAELAAGRVELEPAMADVIADAPGKALGNDAAATVAEAHDALLASARSEVLIASPYFVPVAESRDTLASLRSRDVGVTVLTNSLATTDEPLVHYGYASHRPALLSAGVDLHELMPAQASSGEKHGSFGGSGGGGMSGSAGRLHTKLTVVDEERVFVGSMNMDARSARVNTEAGLVIHSARLARLVAKFLRMRQELASYRVERQGDRLAWRSRGGDVRSEEPRAAEEPGLPVRMLAQLLGEGVL